MAISEFESLGMNKRDAERLARQRLGRYSRYRRAALRELGENYRPLFGLAWFRIRRSALALPALLAVAIGLLLVFNPLRLEALRSIEAAVPFGPAVHVERFAPLTPPGLAPMGFAAATIWLAALLATRRILLIRKVPSTWRLWTFAGLVLALLLGFDAILWATVLQSLLGSRWTSDALQGAALVIFVFVYLGWVWLTTRLCCRDLELRCPICLRRLGMADVRGNAQDLLVAARETETICLYGHGSNLESYWEKVFEPAEADCAQ